MTNKLIIVFILIISLLIIIYNPTTTHPEYTNEFKIYYPLPNNPPKTQWYNNWFFSRPILFL